MRKPRPLDPGCRLAVVALSSPFDREAFDRGIGELERLGFEPVFDDRVFARDGYLAGDARARAAALEGAWRDPSIAGIVAARGGYGSGQLLPLLDPARARAARKPLVGYSDVTAILTFLTCQAGLACFHGPHVAGGLAGECGGYDARSFLSLLTSRAPIGELPAPGLETLRPGEAAGPIYGGNLAVLASTLGTPYAFDPPPGYILFLDEVGERPYRIDRLITQFGQAGLLARAAGVIFGELPGCDEPGGAPTGRAVVEELMRGFAGPVVFNFPSGHTRGPAVTLPLGIRARLVAARAARLIIEEPAVEENGAEEGDEW